MTDKLNIVLVHGAFADGSHWRHIIPGLYEAGHRVMAAQNPLTSLDDDIANTRKLAEWMGGSTLLVGHSYGGAVITGAGRAPNVVGLVYLAAFAPAQGESLTSILSCSDPAPGSASISAAFDEEFLWHRQDTFHDAFCQDLDNTESLIMATTQRPLARRCFRDLTQEPAWNTKPSWYQVSAQDRMIPPQTQRMMAQRIHAREIIELDTSHASFATRPTEVVELILNAAAI
ncbi:alpha/beta hydrolase [Mycobacterium sp. NPDC048908]|uniref:alpha/beta hydrolase n=1 Tax=Mycobacterium sp. NPDC048908 TaxID=3364292 RepID=UPI003716E70C